MREQTEKRKESKSRAVANSITQKKNNVKQGFGFVDNRPAAVAQTKLSEMANSSLQISRLSAFQELVNDSSQTKQVAQLQEMAEQYSASPEQHIHKNERRNLDAGLSKSAYHYQTPNQLSIQRMLRRKGGTDSHEKNTAPSESDKAEKTATKSKSKEELWFEEGSKGPVFIIGEGERLFQGSKEHFDITNPDYRPYGMYLARNPYQKAYKYDEKSLFVKAAAKYVLIATEPLTLTQVRTYSNDDNKDRLPKMMEGARSIGRDGVMDNLGKESQINVSTDSVKTKLKLSLSPEIDEQIAKLVAAKNDGKTIDEDGSFKGLAIKAARLNDTEKVDTEADFSHFNPETGWFDTDREGLEKHSAKRKKQQEKFSHFNPDTEWFDTDWNGLYEEKLKYKEVKAVPEDKMIEEFGKDWKKFNQIGSESLTDKHGYKWNVVYFNEFTSEYFLEQVPNR